MTRKRANAKYEATVEAAKWKAYNEIHRAKHLPKEEYYKIDHSSMAGLELAMKEAHKIWEEEMESIYND